MGSRDPEPAERSGDPSDASGDAGPMAASATSLGELRRRAEGCRACGLWEHATQTVPGRGPSRSPLALVGEQPGDVEDVAGEPFVGPAGELLRSTMEEVGLDPRQAYLTNAVKHFKWKPRGKRRLHDKPSRTEVTACWPWLAAELRLLRPRLVVALGSTASQALLGHGVRVTAERGQILPCRLDVPVLVTVHPSSILRAPSGDDRAAARAAFVSDLAVAVRFLGDGAGSSQALTG